MTKTILTLFAALALLVPMAASAQINRECKIDCVFAYPLE